MFRGRSHLIGDAWLVGQGPDLASSNPATGETLWAGHAATTPEVDQAIACSRQAFDSWGVLPSARRVAYLEAFAGELRRHREELADAISQETGKPRWESLEELGAMIGKVAVSIQALNERRAPISSDMGGVTAVTRFKPLGVLAVLGPFNFPGHLPNGHIVPALLAGNTVVFKPSELTPLVAQKTVELWQAAGLPPGVLTLLQGGRDTGAALAEHPGIDGLLFTGSAAVGAALCRLLAPWPQKILALEMGGNNPLVVWQASNVEAVVYAIIQSAYITAGQRCTCARRLILPAGEEGRLITDHLMYALQKIRVGPYTQMPEPFMGPVISPHAAKTLLDAQARLQDRAGEPILSMQRLGDCRAMLSPGLMDVSRVAHRADEELFGPFLQVIRVPDFQAALQEANATAYGLAAGLLSDSRELYEQFYHRIRAGVVNWNRPTTGASGKLPFGGIGISGNHRPSGYYAADYCSYPIASLEVPRLTLPGQLLPGVAL